MRKAEGPISQAEAAVLFGPLSAVPALVLAVSGGPDSTALMWLVARWRDSLAQPPKLIAVTVDHGLRKESAREALAVKRLALKLNVEHRTVRWTGRKPKTGIQEAARSARYRLLAAAARKIGARHIATAHTFDDQAETVLMRLFRGSGPKGLAAMAPLAPYPLVMKPMLWLSRPLLGMRKARLLATLEAAKIPHAADQSNVDPRFTRARVRALMPALEREGLTAERLVRLSRRIQRSEAAVWSAVEDAAERLAPGAWPEDRPVSVDAALFERLPEAVQIGLLGWLIASLGDEGPIELGKLEAFYELLGPPLTASSHGLHEFGRFRRTLAGAMVTLSGGKLTVERAPPRRTLRKSP
jgi:tRNA(Ile)-lysidine synthase